MFLLITNFYYILKFWISQVTWMKPVKPPLILILYIYSIKIKGGFIDHCLFINVFFLLLLKNYLRLSVNIYSSFCSIFGSLQHSSHEIHSKYFCIYIILCFIVYQLFVWLVYADCIFYIMNSRNLRSALLDCYLNININVTLKKTFSSINPKKDCVCWSHGKENFLKL